MRTTQTRWLLRRVTGRAGLRVELVADTTAPAVVEAIEQAAASNGIVLERRRDCGHDGWQAGCPECEENAALADELLERAERGERGARLRPLEDDR